MTNAGSSIYKEIEREWRTVQKQWRYKPSSRGNFRKFLSGVERETRAATMIGLQPYVGVLEFGLEWLSYIHVALGGKNKSFIPRNTVRRVAWGLVGSAVAFGLSLRSLSLMGLDTPARALLRSYTEMLFLCLAALDDNNFAEAYAKTGNEGNEKTFWYKEASPKKLFRRIAQMLEMSIGFDADAIEDQEAWRQSAFELLSQSSHLSYVGAMLTSMVPALEDSERHVTGVFGRATTSSIATLLNAIYTTWYFSRLSSKFLIGVPKSDAVLLINMKNDLHRRIVFGYEAFNQIVKVALNEHDTSLNGGSPEI